MRRAKQYPFYKILKNKISLNIQNNSILQVPNEKEIFKWVHVVIKNQFSQAMIGILFCDQDEAKYYNNLYRQKDYATNVLSFALNENDDILPNKVLLGDLILSAPIIEKEAREQNKDITTHYAHMIIHGVLHLMGYDHIIDEDANIMENIEIKIMEELGYKNPYERIY